VRKKEQYKRDVANRTFRNFTAISSRRVKNLRYSSKNL